jgi:hypothetical protein
MRHACVRGHHLPETFALPVVSLLLWLMLNAYVGTLQVDNSLLSTSHGVQPSKLLPFEYCEKEREVCLHG